MNQDWSEAIRRLNQKHNRGLSVYDRSFLVKSLEKRLAATALQSAADYCAYLSENEAEVEAFFHSLNITYSEFFRNPLAFALLEGLVLPQLMAEKKGFGQTEIRIWSAGCAAGQEAYSVAMLLDELNATSGQTTFRIFATDHAHSALDAAQKGVYDCAALQNVRMRQFFNYFTQQGAPCTPVSLNVGTFQIIPRLKEQIDFSFYDLLDDHSVCPPASIYGDFDLVICSNLLFYYQPDAREFILDKIYRSLSPTGYLLTGEAERGAIRKADGFHTIVPSAAIFQKNKKQSGN